MSAGSLVANTPMSRIWQAVLSMGLSSALTLVLSAARAKVVAVELGAAGVGILGIVTTTVVLAATALGGGLGGSGVRAVAAAGEAEDSGRRDTVLVALHRGSLLLALATAPLAGLVWWLWGDVVVPQVPSSELAPWVAVSVAATIMTAGEAALLNGQGRIYALAASTGMGAVAGTLVMLLAMYYSHRWGLIASFAAVPLATAWMTTLLVRSHYPRRIRVRWRLWGPELRIMLMLGLAFSSSVILTSATQLIARVWVSRELDIASAGYLQSCFAIGAVYLGFVLNALAAEYYPRISALQGDREQSNAAVDAQVRVVLTLGCPAIVWMIALAPLLLRLLYSAEFDRADTLLRLFLAGDMFKLVGWCVGFLLLAREAKLKFFIAELSWNVFFLVVLLSAAGLGLNVAGAAYLTAYFLYSVVSLVLARRETGFVLSRQSRVTVGWVSGATAAALASAETGSYSGLAVTFLVAVAATATAAVRLVNLTRSGRPTTSQAR